MRNGDRVVSNATTAVRVNIVSRDRMATAGTTARRAAKAASGTRNPLNARDRTKAAIRAKIARVARAITTTARRVTTAHAGLVTMTIDLRAMIGHAGRDRTMIRLEAMTAHAGLVTMTIDLKAMIGPAAPDRTMIRLGAMTAHAGLVTMTIDLRATIGPAALDRMMSNRRVTHGRAAIPVTARVTTIEASTAAATGPANACAKKSAIACGVASRAESIQGEDVPPPCRELGLLVLSERQNDRS